MFLDEELLRQEFGFLEKWGCIHLNCCSVGVPPMSVQRAGQEFFSERGYMRLVKGQLPKGYEPYRDQTREKIARLICAESAEIAFVSSTTEGLAMLAAGYPLGKGDNAVICDLENPACMYPWLGARKNRGFELRVVRTEHGEIDPSTLFQHVDRDTRVIVLSAVQYGTGFFADLQAIGDECRRRGIVFAVDAIQAAGRMKINVQDMKIDFLSCGGFKGIGAGFGIGFVYCRRALATQITPVFAGVNETTGCLTAPEVFGPSPEITLRPDARRLETGSQNTAGIVLLDVGIDVLLKLDVEKIQAHVLGLESILRDSLSGSGLHFDGPRDEKNRSGIVVVRYPQELYAFAQELLDSRNIFLTSRPGYMRMAIHCYNTEEQMAAVSSVLSEIASLSGKRVLQGSR